MKKYLKKQLLSIIYSLEKSNDLISKILGNNNGDIMEVLIKCQESAIQIGTTIEEIEPEETNAVKLLEEYCELVYQISQNSSDKQKIKKLLKKMRSLLIQIGNSIRNDLPDSNREVVFLPYKASMWDSMESVWLAAKEDEKCDCYVIPIPYFDRKSDGTFGQMYYEGNEYPDYVPITSWEEYSISEHRPDVIYIHNPYDENNYVTSVHPAFYAKELKKYTDMLVYIPYFVDMYDDVPEHFVVLPGTMYADRVIVQSEKARQKYIEEFCKFEEQYNCKDRFGIAEEKFLALGSPKFDKVLNTRREDVDIPEEWEKLIIKQDGIRKKVILYNTSIKILLDYKKKMIEKLKDVLQIFKENPDVVLLWRPHPLSETTIKALTPEVLKTYKEIIDNYKAEGWGIYDDTADLNRAIAISDAYYGDRSSVVALYQKTGKPIMIQNVEITDDFSPANRNIYFDNLTYDGNEAWFTGANINGIFKLDIDKAEAEYVTSIPSARTTDVQQYSKIVRYKDYLLLVPRRGKKIYKYDIKSGCFKNIDLDYNLMKDRELFNLFFGAVQVGHYVYLIPGRYPAIVRVDMISDEVTYYTDWYKEINDKIYNERKAIFISCNCVNDNTIALPFWQGNCVLMFNLIDASYDIRKVGDNKYEFSSIVYDGNDYWISVGNEVVILKWNCKNDTVEEFRKFPPDLVMTYENQGFEHIEYYYNGYLLAFPINGNMVVKINIQNEEAVPFQKLPTTCNQPNQDILQFTNFLSYIRYEDSKMLCYSIYDNMYKKIDFKEETCADQRMVLSNAWSDVDIKAYLHFGSKGYNIIDKYDMVSCECNKVTIMELLSYLVSDNKNQIEEKSRHIDLKDNELAGSAIYNYSISCLK